MQAVADYRKRLRKIRKFHLILCLLGLVISSYSVYVELSLESNPNYKALCDISPEISCTAVFASEWGKGFGFIGKLVGENSTLNQPNAVYGVISYPIFIFTSRFDNMFLAKMTLLLGTLGVLLSAYLAYVLYFILEGICVVCIAIYIVSFFLFITSVLCYRTQKTIFEVLTINAWSSTGATKPISKKRV